MTRMRQRLDAFFCERHYLSIRRLVDRNLLELFSQGNDLSACQQHVLLADCVERVITYCAVGELVL